MHGNRHGTKINGLPTALSLGMGIAVTAVVLPAVLATTGALPGFSLAPAVPRQLAGPTGRTLPPPHGRFTARTRTSPDAASRGAVVV